MVTIFYQNLNKIKIKINYLIIIFSIFFINSHANTLKITPIINKNIQVLFKKSFFDDLNKKNTNCIKTSKIDSKFCIVKYTSPLDKYIDKNKIISKNNILTYYTNNKLTWLYIPLKKKYNKYIKQLLINIISYPSLIVKKEKLVNSVNHILIKEYFWRININGKIFHLDFCNQSDIITLYNNNSALILKKEGTLNPLSNFSLEKIKYNLILRKRDQ